MVQSLYIQSIIIIVVEALCISCDLLLRRNLFNETSPKWIISSSSSSSSSNDHTDGATCARETLKATRKCPKKRQIGTRWTTLVHRKSCDSPLSSFPPFLFSSLPLFVFCLFFYCLLLLWLVFGDVPSDSRYQLILLNRKNNTKQKKKTLTQYNTAEGSGTRQQAGTSKSTACIVTHASPVEFTPPPFESSPSVASPPPYESSRHWQREWQWQCECECECARR